MAMRRRGQLDIAAVPTIIPCLGALGMDAQPSPCPFSGATLLDSVRPSPSPPSSPQRLIRHENMDTLLGFILAFLAEFITSHYVSRFPYSSPSPPSHSLSSSFLCFHLFVSSSSSSLSLSSFSFCFVFFFVFTLLSYSSPLTIPSLLFLKLALQDTSITRCPSSPAHRLAFLATHKEKESPPLTILEEHTIWIDRSANCFSI